MKKITLLLAGLFISTVMFGQFTIGPQVGYTSSTLSYNKNDIQSALKSNLVLGVFARIGKKVYLQPELNYLTQGSVFKFGDGTEQTANLKSIQVPLSLGVKLVDAKVVKVRLFGGATANFIVNKDISTSTLVSTTGDYLTASNFKDANYQYQVGVGVDVLMFALDVKYYGPLDKLVNGSVTYNSQTHTVDAGSSVFMVTLGWKLF
ncbi:MAG: PorT family protein [Bacteroidales bacterium]|nr:PorT family protein [Bacteroidales bacterium]